MLQASRGGPPRPEHPRPQFARDQWLSLNGAWEFEPDPGDSGFERGLVAARSLAGRITVPFCPESQMSGIGHTDRVLAVWYRRVVTVPRSWAGRDVLLHFGAVDHDATVWVDGVEVARHRGGFTPFTCDLRGLVEPGREAVITVRARDDWRGAQARGKQSQAYANSGCHYTRTTGIWQTVWLEGVNRTRFQRPRITPDLAAGGFRVELPLDGDADGHRVCATLRDGAGLVAQASAPAEGGGQLWLGIPEARRRAWSPEDPHLYDLALELQDARGAVVDAVSSYAGLRSVSIRGHAILLNGRPLFQRLVLDQGWWPDSLMTAPSDAALIEDIRLAQRAGFNGARLHQKVFEERFLYHADRLGYLCWGEFGDWSATVPGAGADPHRAGASLVAQWLEALERDYSHPAIVGWCPLNETTYRIEDHIEAHDDTMRALFLATKALDRTRPVLDVSGYSHRIAQSDVYDSHDYEQDPVTFAANHAGLAQGKPFINASATIHNAAYRGQPYFVSEFGGIWWNPDARADESSWGYGDRPKDAEAVYARFAALCAVLLDDPRMFGYCYTQLTDVFQEQNGVVRFDRSLKLDLERLRAAQARPAAIEGERATFSVLRSPSGGT